MNSPTLLESGTGLTGKRLLRLTVSAQEKYRGIGSLMVEMATQINL